MFSLISRARATEDDEPTYDPATRDERRDQELRRTWDEVRAQAISSSDREEIDAVFARHCA